MESSDVPQQRPLKGAGHHRGSADPGLKAWARRKFPVQVVKVAHYPKATSGRATSDRSISASTRASAGPRREWMRVSWPATNGASRCAARAAAPRSWSGAGSAAVRSSQPASPPPAPGSQPARQSLRRSVRPLCGMCALALSFRAQRGICFADRDVENKADSSARQKAPASE